IQDSVRCSNSPVVFSNESKGVNLHYTWTFSDGSTDTTFAPLHSYANEGIYSVSLAVADVYGCTDTITRTNAVSILNPHASFSLSDSVIACPPAQITFFNSSTNTTSVNWDFADGNFSNLDSPFHYFLTARDYR